MKNKLKKQALLIAAMSTYYLLSVRSVFAQKITIGNGFDTNEQVGSIATVTQIFYFIFSALKYFGWAGVIIGIAWTIFELIYKLISEDSEKVMQRVQGHITKAVIIVIAGILLMSVGFIVKAVSGLIGADVTINPEN